jgi:hypothetical protein
MTRRIVCFSDEYNEPMGSMKAENFFTSQKEDPLNPLMKEYPAWWSYF